MQLIFFNFALPTINSCSIGNATNATNVTAPKNATKESTKNKKSKDKDQKAAEEKRRQQEEEERQQLEERNRLELIAAQRKAKLVDPNLVARVEQTMKRNNLAASIGMGVSHCFPTMKTVPKEIFNLRFFAIFFLFSTVVKH